MCHFVSYTEYNVVLENYSVQNSPWGGEGGLLSAQGLCTNLTYEYLCHVRKNLPAAKYPDSCVLDLYAWLSDFALYL